MASSEYPVRANPLFVLGILFLVRTAFGVQFQSVGAVGPALKQELGLSYTSLGTLVGAYSAFGMVTALLAGWLIARFGDRRILLTGTILMTVGGALLAVAPGLPLAMAGRVISGGGSVLLAVVGPKMVMDRFSDRQLPAAMATMIIGFPLGNGLGLVGLPFFASWRVAMAASAAFCAVTVAGACYLTATPATGPAGVSRSNPLSMRVLVPLVVVACVWTLLNAGWAVLAGFGPTFFVGRGLPESTAGQLVSLAPFIMVPICPVAGWLVGRLGHPLKAVGIGLALSAATLAALPAGVTPLIPLLLFGAVNGVIAGPIMALPAEVLAPEHRALGMGLFFSIYHAGLTLLPPVAGYAADVTGSIAAPIHVAALFYLLSLAAFLAYLAVHRTVALSPPPATELTE